MANPADTLIGPAARKSGGFQHYRWVICGLLFYATTINYIDRQVLGILKPVLQKELGWQESDYGYIVFAFQAAYAILMPIAGRILDWLGTRIGYALAVAIWSVAAMSHSLAQNALQFSAARFMLGLGEAGNFPAALKTVADWFPQRERALATGIFNSGSNIGAIVAPMAVPWIALHFGWRAAFLGTALFSFTWILLWLGFYRPARQHPRLSAEEFALIHQGREKEPPAIRVPALRLMQCRGMWAFLLGKFLTDPVWWFYLFWLPGFLNSTYGLDLSHLGAPLITIYLSADIGSIGGGWLSSTLLQRGWTPNRARKTAMFVCAAAVTGVIFVMHTGGNLWLAVALISIAAAAHQGWSANLYTLVSDVFPTQVVGSVTGLGGFGGALGGMLVAPAIGKWLEISNKSYGPLFVVAGVMYLIALAVIHLLVPRLDKEQIEVNPAA